MTSIFPNLALLQLPFNGILGPVFMYGAIFAIFYFILIRPGQKQRKEQDLLIKAVKKGDEIITSGGLVGDVIFIKESMVNGTNVPNEDRITIKSGESRVIVERGRIARVSRSGPGSATQG